MPYVPELSDEANATDAASWTSAKTLLVFLRAPRLHPASTEEFQNFFVSFERRDQVRPGNPVASSRPRPIEHFPRQRKSAVARRVSRLFHFVQHGLGITIPGTSLFNRRACL